MSEFSSPGAAVLPTHISTYSQWCSTFVGIRPLGIANITGPASYTLPAANTALYFPFVLPWAYPVARVFWVNGSAVVSNMEMGIYSLGLTKAYSTGSVAQSGASVPQYVDNTDFWLAPGAYYLALTCSGTTNVLFGKTTVTATLGRALGMFQSSHAPGSLPATVSPAQNAQASFPVFGFTRMASGY